MEHSRPDHENHPEAAESTVALPPTPAPAQAQERRRTCWMQWLPLLLAVGWLIPSVLVGLNLIQDEPNRAESISVTTPSLTASSDLVTYGGDAYTGIQNAAAYTEKAVVDGTNELAAFQLDLAKATAAADARRSASNQARLEDGLGILIIGVAVVNLTIALSRVFGPA